jgi:hypothetical protein
VSQERATSESINQDAEIQLELRKAFGVMEAFKGVDDAVHPFHIAVSIMA